MATEDRWHDFAKEKPSEDMEGRNFIVSNGYSDTLSMWCGGYWENEPFMGNKLCDEVVRWKGYLTPEEEKANSQCDIDEVDCTAAELKQKLDEKDKDIAYWRKEYDQETKLTDALKAEIESLKASHYAEMVDAGMRERRLRRALWKLKALYFFRMFQWSMEGKRLALEDDEPEDFFMECMGKYIKRKSEWGKEADMFDDARIVCIKKAEEYK